MQHLGPVQSNTVDGTPPEQRAQAYQCPRGHTTVMGAPALTYIAIATSRAPWTSSR